METFSAVHLREFVSFTLRNDLQILVNRREARRLYYDALAEGPGAAVRFSYPVEKAEKIATFLETHDLALAGNNVSIYAFVRLMGDLRRSLEAPIPPDYGPAGAGGAAAAAAGG